MMCVAGAAVSNRRARLGKRASMEASASLGNRHMDTLRIALVIAALAGVTPKLLASEAAFSEDGKLVYATTDEPGTLDVIDEDAGTLTHLKVHTGDEDEEFRGISRAA